MKVHSNTASMLSVLLWSSCYLNNFIYNTYTGSGPDYLCYNLLLCDLIRNIHCYKRWNVFFHVDVFLELLSYVFKIIQQSFSLFVVLYQTQNLIISVKIQLICLLSPVLTRLNKDLSSDSAAVEVNLLLRLRSSRLHSYPSPAVRAPSSPSWPASSGDAPAGAGAAGGAKQPPQHSPSTEPSGWHLASRWKPGSKEGGSILGGPDPSGVPGGAQRMRSRLYVRSPGSRSSLVSGRLRAPRLHALPRLSRTTSCVSQYPSPSQPTPLPGFGEEQD